MSIATKTAAALVATVRQNSINAALLDRLPRLGLPDCWLVAGCLFQTVWNVQSGRPAAEGIRDYDVFYFDGNDLTYEAEDRLIKRIAAACADLGVTIELRNQARVHLWYRARFGHDYPQLTSSADSIDRFLVRCTCVGMRCVAGEEPALYARYGLDELKAGVLSPNPLNHPESRFAEKAASYQRRWPWLQIQLAGQP
jgi:uncharacterized protein